MRRACELGHHVWQDTKAGFLVCRHCRTKRLRAPPVRVEFRRFPDGCYAVVVGRRRGPCGHCQRTALARYRRSGLVAPLRRTER